MIITVIGHLCLDFIRHPDGAESRGYGGIFFSVATLANLLSPRDTVRPVFGVGKGEYDELLERLGLYPNVDTSGIFRLPAQTNQVTLTYVGAGKRVERSEFIADPIPWKRIRSQVNGATMVLVNMISGFDISLETLDEIRMAAREDRVPIYLDVHSLTLGVGDDFTRFHRPVETWRRWLFMLHGVHLNEEEAAILPPERFDEETLANHVLALNTKTMHITRAERGCTAYVDDRKHIRRLDVPGIPAGARVDPTGCGDVFVAAYCAHYMKSKEIPAAVEFANRVAAQKARLAGSAEIDTLSTFRLEENTLEERTP